MSDSDGSFDCRPRVIAFKGEVLVTETEDVLYFRIDLHYRQGARFARKLEGDLFEMILVDVGVTGCMDEFSRLQAAYLGYHHGQKSIGSDVERHPEEHIGASLVQLA